MSRFIPNQIVWAKVKGYPWWPAMIIKVKEHKSGNSMADILVNFIGENSHATLPEDKINGFDEKFKQFSAGKGKKLQDAIKAALSILEENMAYEESLKKAAAPKTKHVQQASKASKAHKSNEGQKREGSRRKESPHEFESIKEDRLGRKPKGKEDKKGLVYDHLLDFIPHRVTRSQLKSQHIEVPTEPLIYGSRKPVNAGAKNNKNKSQTDEMEVESAQGYGGDSRKASGDFPFMKHKMNNEDCNHDETKMGSTSPAETFDGSLSNGSQRHTVQGRIRDKKAVTPKDNKNKKLIVSEFQNLESTEPHQGDPVEPRHLIEDALKPLTEVNEQDIDLMPRLVKDQNEASQCCSGSILEHSEHLLKEIMNKFTNKFKNNEIIIEQDEDVMKLLSVIEDFQKHDLKGSELISSNIGKLFKTIHYILIKNKHVLNKPGNAVISVLARILHHIKDRILKYCLDNTGYVESLRLPFEKQELSLQATITIPPVEIDEIKTKIEELASESDHKGIIILDDPLSITTKVDDEEMLERAGKDQFHISKGQTISNLHDIPALSMKHTVSSPCAQSKSNACSNNNKAHSQNHHGITFALRKKACQRLAKMIQESYKLEKDKSQELTLVLEGKIYGLYMDLADDYKETIKNIYKILKLKFFSIEELTSMKELNGNAFDLMLKNKLAYLSESEHAAKDSLHEHAEMLMLVRNDSRNSTTLSFSSEILDSNTMKNMCFENGLTGRCNGFLSESPRGESLTSKDFMIPTSHHCNSGKKNDNSLVN